MTDDWDLDPSQFDDEFETTRLNKAMIKILDLTGETLDEMRKNLERNERKQFSNRLTYLVNRLSQLAQLSSIEDNPELTEEQVEAFVAEAEAHSNEVDWDNLFQKNDDDGAEGLDVIKYIEPPKKDDDGDDFGF